MISTTIFGRLALYFSEDWRDLSWKIGTIKPHTVCEAYDFFI